MTAAWDLCFFVLLGRSSFLSPSYLQRMGFQLIHHCSQARVRNL